MVSLYFKYDEDGYVTSIIINGLKPEKEISYLLDENVFKGKICELSLKPYNERELECGSDIIHRYDVDLPIDEGRKIKLKGLCVSTGQYFCNLCSVKQENVLRWVIEGIFFRFPPPEVSLEEAVEIEVDGKDVIDDKYSTEELKKKYREYKLRDQVVTTHDQPYEIIESDYGSCAKGEYEEDVLVGKVSTELYPELEVCFGFDSPVCESCELYVLNRIKPPQEKKSKLSQFIDDLSRMLSKWMF